MHACMHACMHARIHAYQDMWLSSHHTQPYPASTTCGYPATSTASLSHKVSPNMWLSSHQIYVFEIQSRIQSINQ